MFIKDNDQFFLQLGHLLQKSCKIGNDPIYMENVYFCIALNALKIIYLHIFVGWKEANNFFGQSLRTFLLI